MSQEKEKLEEIAEDTKAVRDMLGKCLFQEEGVLFHLGVLANYCPSKFCSLVRCEHQGKIMSFYGIDSSGKLKASQCTLCTYGKNSRDKK